MRSYKKYRLIIVLMAVILAGCGGSEKKSGEAPISPASILDACKITGIDRISEVQTYNGESLYEYIDGGAEVFHQYGFVRVSTADFNAGGLEVVADIYEFAGSDKAFGLYSTIRPPNVETINIGVQGFLSETSFDFVKGRYLARLVCYDGTGETGDVLNRFATGLNEIIPGVASIPEMFNLFPNPNRVANSEKIIARSFLGNAGVDDVFTVDYSLNDETVQFFVSDDADGAKYGAWAEKAAIDPDALKSIKDLPFDPGKMFMADDSYYGKILVGAKNGKLVGAVGYRDIFNDFFKEWLNAISE